MTLRAAALLLVSWFTLTGCDGGSTGESAATEPLTWYSTCGDPACSGYSGPFTDVPLCTSETEGAACADPAASCDPVTDCNTLLTCTTEDPKAQTGGCPISRRRHKTDIRYLDDQSRKAAANQLYETRLAEWRYRWDTPARRPHLGFLIDDQAQSPAVSEDGEHVDLYGYTSLTVAAVQEEHAARLVLEARVQQQEAELQRLQAELAELRAGLAALQAR